MWKSQSLSCKFSPGTVMLCISDNCTLSFEALHHGLSQDACYVKLCRNNTATSLERTTNLPHRNNDDVNMIMMTFAQAHNALMVNVPGTLSSPLYHYVLLQFIPCYAMAATARKVLIRSPYVTRSVEGTSRDSGSCRRIRKSGRNSDWTVMLYVLST